MPRAMISRSILANHISLARLASAARIWPSMREDLDIFTAVARGGETSRPGCRRRCFTGARALRPQGRRTMNGPRNPHSAMRLAGRTKSFGCAARKKFMTIERSEEKE